MPNNLWINNAVKSHTEYSMISKIRQIWALPGVPRARPAVQTPSFFLMHSQNKVYFEKVIMQIYSSKKKGRGF